VTFSACKSSFSIKFCRFQNIVLLILKILYYYKTKFLNKETPVFNLTDPACMVNHGNYEKNCCGHPKTFQIIQIKNYDFYPCFAVTFLEHAELPNAKVHAVA
jgi:hypothetical protein